ILEGARHAFPRRELGLMDARSSYAGVRGVIDSGAADPSKESREHAIWREDGLLTITGGKLTTFAVMARDALGAAEAELGELGERTRVLEPNAVDVKWPSSIDEGARTRLLGRFGAETAAVLADASLARPIDGTVALASEVKWAAREEGVVTLSDLLLRRARVGLFLPNGGAAHMAEIKKLAQPELGWDDARWEREEAAYFATWKKAYSVPR
ncbi:MAG TPA: glycerol-3-phosphate dehydrogenase C-terminal domain-containing protein, partial [Labilithrix sp.]